MIGQGATAEIFELDGNRVLKLFRSGMPEAFTKREYGNAVIVNDCSVPSPKVLDCIERDGRTGIIYERARGRSMLKSMMIPWKIKKDAELLADLQYEIHQKKPKGLPLFKQMLERNIRHTKLLTDSEKQTILGILEDLPDGDSLCHSDFHPDNILLYRGKPVILDWMTACVGDPAADVARTSLILTTSELPGSLPQPVKNYVLQSRERIHTLYLKKYSELSGITQEQIDAWKVPMMAARLVERRPQSENDLLVQGIRRFIGSKEE